MRQEFGFFGKMWSFKRVSNHPRLYFSRRGGVEVHALMTGIGLRGVGSELRSFFELPVDICIATGLAGSLRAEHKIGAILAAGAVRREGSQTALRSDETLLKSAIECGATPVACFHNSDRVVTSAAEKLRLGEHADAVEMESFQIMTEACERDIPVVAVRSISDTVDRDVPLDFNRAINSRGEIGWYSAMSQIASGPAAIPRLMRFGFESSRSAKKLAYFLDRYLNCLMGGADLHLVSARSEAG